MSTTGISEALQKVSDVFAADPEKAHSKGVPATARLVGGLRFQVTGPGGEEVEFYTIAGGGHAWPGGQKLPGFIVGRTPQSIDATRVMWQFFQRHPLHPINYT